MPEVSLHDRSALIRDKYAGVSDPALLQEDLARLAAGEPLAYIIGWQPFLDLRISLDSHPLIPRPETEHWTELLIAHLQERFGTKPFRLLDLCAGSGAIGLAVLKACPQAFVFFGELSSAHAETIKKNLQANGLDENRADIRTSDLFAAFAEEQFDIITTNPPYIPEGRTLPESVSHYEPAEALYAGTDGLSLIRTIAAEASSHLNPDGELWMECDIANIEVAQELLLAGGARDAAIRSDQYGRSRYVVAHY